MQIFKKFLSDDFTNRWHDEFVGKETDGWKDTVGKQWNRCERVDGCVGVSETLKPLEFASFVAVPERAVPAEEDFNRPECPTQNLV